MSWEDNVKRVVPYVPGEQPKSKVIKLNTNENPYPPSPKVREVLSNYDIDELRLYPDVNAGELGMALAKYYGLNSNQVFVGVGSDDVLAIAFMTFFNSDKEILFPDITYSFYDVWADLYKIPYRMVELNDDFRINIEDYLVPNGGIVIPNPNAPTGVEKDVRELEKIVAKNPDSVVIIDEAYVDFGATSMLPLINKYDNLLIVQTYSKSRSMAGARIGMAFGNEKLIKYMNDVKFSINSYTMNRLTVAAGTAALEDEEYFKETCDKVIATRERTKVRLRELGFDMPDSKSNFVFATHESIPASDIFNAAKSAGIYLRWWNKDRISNRLRISIGTDEEMDALFAFLKEYIEARG
ncbi:histidinol-phosphate transaminase [Lacrimispora saccharolytica]|uniref:histidinol-phosphate transaminase n=1 Tax=Lacrimispora saccharolytica TaxID=84030 RepID=UPI00265D39FC|nr:histidinol-phosphate transaminase [Lacrimispora saccharolytica]MCF2655771.1 histidinol-phosphate transaminase [Lacrimispora saccharolytica]